MKKDDKYKEDLFDFIREKGQEEAFSYAIDIIINTTKLEAIFMDPTGEFIIMCKPETADSLIPLLGVDMTKAQIGYAEDEDESDITLYSDLDDKTDKGNKVH